MPTKFRFALLFVFIFVLAGLGFTQDTIKSDPSIARMRKDITFLASKECEGRGVGTAGLEMAANYIADQFKKAGLKPGGVNGTYFQPFPFATGASLDGTSTLVLQGPQDQKIVLKQGTDFQVLGTSSAAKLSAPLVFVGYGATARDTPYDDYAGIDVKGKIVIALRRVPRYASKDLPFDGSNRDAVASLDAKQSGAFVHKAAAVILVNDASELPKDVLASFQTTSAGISTISMPFVTIKRAVIDDVIRSSTGATLAETEKAIDGDLKPRSAVLTGWTASIDVKVKRKEVPVKNVIAVLEGSGPLANETVVVGAHYDHLGFKDKKIEIKSKDDDKAPPKKESKSKDDDKATPKTEIVRETYHGADDNGSGTTAMMELARRFAAIKNREGRRMVFMAFTAEERGLIGSRHYCKVEPLFPLKDTAAMFNLDMVGRLKDPDKDKKDAKSTLLVEGFDTAKEFDALVTKLNPGFDIIKKNSFGFISSDQYSFYQQKIPVVFFWTGTHPDYHKITDTSDKINVAGMKRIADYAQLVIDHLRTEPKRPEFVSIPFKFGAPGGGPQGPRFGIMPDLDYTGKGVLVELVLKDGAADKAGVKKGDLVLEIAGKVVTAQTMRAVMATQKVNVAIDVKILRDKEELMLKLTPK